MTYIERTEQKAMRIFDRIKTGAGTKIQKESELKLQLATNFPTNVPEGDIHFLVREKIMNLWYIWASEQFVTTENTNLGFFSKKDIRKILRETSTSREELRQRKKNLNV